MGNERLESWLIFHLKCWTSSIFKRRPSVCRTLFVQGRSFKLFVYGITDSCEVRKLKRVRPNTHVFMSSLRSNDYRTCILVRTKIFPVSVKKKKKRKRKRCRKYRK
jgi:hypothetical protein